MSEITINSGPAEERENPPNLRDIREEKIKELLEKLARQRTLAEKIKQIVGSPRFQQITNSSLQVLMGSYRVYDTAQRISYKNPELNDFAVVALAIASAEGVNLAILAINAALRKINDKQQEKLKEFILSQRRDMGDKMRSSKDASPDTRLKSQASVKQETLDG